MSSYKFDACLREDIPLGRYMSFLAEVLNLLVFSAVMKNFTIGAMSICNTFFGSV